MTEEDPVEIDERLRTFAHTRKCTSGFDNETLESLADQTVKDAGENVIGFIHGTGGKTACYNKSDLFRYWLAKVDSFRGYVQTPEGQPEEPSEEYFFNFPLPPLIDTFIDSETAKIILKSNRYLFRLHPTEYRYYDTNPTLLIGAYHNRHRGGDPYVIVSEVYFYSQKEGLAIPESEINEAFQRAIERADQEVDEEQERLLLERTFLREGETLTQALQRLTRTEDLSQVTDLNLTDMNLESLPSEIIALTPKLERLIVSRNHLTTLPVEMPNWENLHRVIADHNQISIVPVTMGNMPKVNIVDFSFNKIHNFPPSFYNLKLRYLYVDGNPLTEETQEELLEWMVRQIGTENKLDVDIFTPEYLASREAKELETKEELEPPAVRRRLFEPQPELEEEFKAYDIIWYTHRLTDIPEAGMEVIFQTGTYWSDILSWGENIQRGRVFLIDGKYYVPQLPNPEGYVYRDEGVYESLRREGDLIRFGVEDTEEELDEIVNVNDVVWWSNPIVSRGYSQEVIYQEGEAFYGEVVWRTEPAWGDVIWNDEKQGFQIDDKPTIYRWNAEEGMYQSGNRRLRIGSLNPQLPGSIYWITNAVEPSSLPDTYMYQFGEYYESDDDISWFFPPRLGRVMWNPEEGGVYIEGYDVVYRHRPGTQGLYFGPNNTLLRLGLRYPSF